MLKRFKIYILFIILIILGFIFYNNRIVIKEYFIKSNNIELPEEIKFVEIVEDLVEDLDRSGEDQSGEEIEDINKDESISEEIITELEIEEINLAVPFTIQSPDQKWELPFKEGCEEAVILMVYSFLNDKQITVNSALYDIGAMVDWQMTNYGGHFDLSATTTAEMAEKFYNLDVEIIKLSSIEQIKNIVSTGYPLILPCAGRELSNPYFRIPGPVYHMLVVKGFKDNLIITNDPGTKRGKDYVYEPDVLWNAIADWDYSIMNPNQDIKMGILVK